jgi:hypothetical protein
MFEIDRELVMKVILGGGISGLIFAYYHKDYAIITEDVGGQMKSHFDIGPRYLHLKSEIVKDFLQRLDVPTELSTIRVGFLDDTGWVKKLDVSFRQKYYLKSRQAKDLSGFDDSVMNTNLREFDVLRIDFKELILNLFERVADRIYYGKIEKIDIEKQQICVTDICNSTLTSNFDKLVSTIPLNVFLKIANLDINSKEDFDIDLKAYDMSYCLVPDDFFFMREFDFIYDCGNITQFHRMTKTKYGIVLDFFGSRTLEEIQKLFPIYKIQSEDLKVLKNSQIISLKNDFKLENENIRFFGRYGAWNRRWKTETVIEESQNE